MAITSTTASFHGGSMMGQVTSEKIGFYGTTTYTQQTKPTFTVTTGAVSTTTGAITSWGFSTAAQADTLTVAVRDIIVVLTNLGLVA